MFIFIFQSTFLEFSTSFLAKQLRKYYNTKIHNALRLTPVHDPSPANFRGMSIDAVHRVFTGKQRAMETDSYPSFPAI